jgi:hypothetical protein
VAYLGSQGLRQTRLGASSWPVRVDARTGDFGHECLQSKKHERPKHE